MRGLVLLLAALVPSGAAHGAGDAPRGEATVTQAALSMAMGRCVVKRNRRAATALVLAGDEPVEKAARDRVSPDMIACLGQRHSATLDGLHLRSAIAEALLADADGTLLDRLATLPAATPVRVAAGDGAGQAALACAVRGDPVDAAAMLRAVAETPAEAAAFRALGPSLQACVPATGAVSIPSHVVRATIAIAGYRAAAAAR